MVSRQRKWQIRQIEDGKCNTCGEKREHYKQHCDSCAVKIRKRIRERDGHKKHEDKGRGRIPFVKE